MVTVYEYREHRIDMAVFQNMTFYLHLHKQIELLYIESGTILTEINGVQNMVEAGDICIAFPNQAHSYRSQGETKGVMLIFDPSLIPDYSTILTNKQPFVSFLKKDTMHKDIKMCIRAMQNDSSIIQSESLLKGYLTVLMARITAETGLCDNSLRENGDTLYQVLQYLNHHFKESISLGTLAIALGISKYYLSHIFSHKIGCSFNTYLNSLRIDYAEGLLTNTNMNITEIAFECGFDSTCTFFRAFRQLKGMTPKQLRIQLGEYTHKDL